MKKPDLNNKPVAKIFPELVKKIDEGKCPLCGKTITGFKDALSIKEYHLSGICQSCQDDFFD